MDLIQHIPSTEQIILDANYIMFDGALWSNFHKNLEAWGIPFYFIGGNIFSKNIYAPTLVDLTRVDEEQKKELWEMMGQHFSSDISTFQQTNVFQTYIKTSKSTDELKKFLADFMVLRHNGQKYLFRYYDPRVAIHFPAIFRLTYQNFRTDNPFDVWQDHIENWVVTIHGGHYRILKEKEIFSQIQLEQIETVNGLMTEFTDTLYATSEQTSQIEGMSLAELIQFSYKQILG